MNNEPVAWISVLGVDLIGQKFTDVRVSLTKTDVASIPLYTHPVKEISLSGNYAEILSKNDETLPNGKLELTDEEIREVAKSVEYEGIAQWKYEFARAILRKAQEK